MKPQTPSLTVDAVIIHDGKLCLIQRRNPPYRGMWALPGGFVDVGERVEEACLREVREETGLDVEIESLVGIYSDPERDPRGHTVSAVYRCRVKGGELAAGDDAGEARWFALPLTLRLAFDHAEIVADALEADTP